MSIPRSSHTSKHLGEISMDTISHSSLVITTITLVAVTLISFAVFTNRSKYPLANPPRWFETRLTKRLEFMKHGPAIIEDARKLYGNQPYKLLTDLGECFVLPPPYANIIRNEKDLSFSKAIYSDFNADVHGFEPFGGLEHQKRIVQAVTKKQLTKYLSKKNKICSGYYKANDDAKDAVTEPLSKEATYAVDVIFGKDPEWKETNITDSILSLIARLSSKVFLGDELCRNEAWLRVTKIYTVNGFKAATQISAYPPALKMLFPWFSKDAKVVAQNLKDARNVIAPIINQRNQIKDEAKRSGKSVPNFNDMLEWLEQESQGSAYDPATYQILLSFAAIHTTSDLASQALMRLAQEPHLIAELREEIIRVIGSDGLTKAALSNLKLMDSALKETQRVKPNVILTMRREAKRKVVLPDGLTINKGDRVVVDGINMLDPEIYPNPEKFDIYRYYRMRQDPATANKAHLVSTGPENLSFGHGSQACPGRFFAANEIKIAFCHLLLKYDWELAPGANMEPLHVVGDQTVLDPRNKLRFRRRKEELDLDTLVFVKEEGKHEGETDV
ncbi:ent-kaurene oxidase [Pyrenophora seminiperda CCB06]|uniref:Ent-kaurene oxidase n=1 Tax=Pyrenophora seminiperda CCB06 TaxID=1302712 RepID=A0A3M7MAB5_9PLEO|nr:ent-kaurene oxidase [Pyrenophora seminiperda CCB06]